MQLLVYVLVYPLLWIISRLPYKLFYFFSDVVYIIVYRIFGYRKKVVRDNLTLVFPKKCDIELRRIEKDFYKHMCDMFLEMVKTMNLSKEEVKKRYHVTNMQVLKDILNDKSILVVCAHYANWEWNVSMNNYIDDKGYAVYQKISNKHFDSWITKTRARWNTTLITQRETVKTVMANAKNNVKAVYGMVSDQSPMVGRAQYWTEFMDIKVPIFNGAETMARKLDLAVVFLKVSKVKRGYYTAEFIPITTNATNTEKNEITDQFLRLTEQQIKEKPEHYLWTHRRWKHRNRVPKEYL
ncbi:KDO2-lipid IV(A) lauroyltransferase [Maribacter vaceletii]|uniref:KDO2-lipid IV(A) lauroyltransferase n=1 Tax=Maribacter vaceletii TaxID=1206816 RepID=A0A495E9I5_9FLAO|nr:lysophospholipid acyltransferase family protein [Maribacter vaceletii]RKR13173.1 KDO2-lipid IV(A) lauroyltransferase [Maribacter vaceletii]